MKIALLFVIGVWGGGCATQAQHFSGGAASLAVLNQHCVAERSMQISREWSRYEFKYRRQVLYPNWREMSATWARYECAHGRPIARFHPGRVRR